MRSEPRSGEDTPKPNQATLSVSESPPAPRKGARLLNRDGVLSNVASEQFASLLKEQLTNGYGFVPFIGAGMSAPSGAPLVWDIKTYLQHCIGLALGIADGQIRAWNPRTDRWPPFVTTTSNDQGAWLHRIQERIDSFTRDDKWHPDLPVLQEALGAIAEWRTALQFLSRLVHEERDKGGDTTIGFVLDEPRQEVVDACLRTILKGKRPTLGHRMLAALGGLLRLDMILTTNFDDLLEIAFSEARNPLTVFEVHLGSTLPAYSAVGTQRSLIKLHGNRHSLRADYTLDASPTAEDLERFLDYLVAGETIPGSRAESGLLAGGHERIAPPMVAIGAGDKSAPPIQARYHLLVMGTAASERRTTAFIRYAWHRLGKTFKVFWICHTKDDVARVTKFTETFFNDHRADDPEWEGSIVLRHTHLGLLFLHLFQYIRHAVPTTGLVFPTTSRLALPPLGCRDDTASTSAGRIAFRNRLLERLKYMMKSSASSPRLMVVTSHHDIAGVTSVCADVFEDLEVDAVCIWLDLNDVMSTDDLFEQLLDAMYYRLGIEAWLPIAVAVDAASRADEIRRLARLTTRPWVVFLNARETTGSNRPDFDTTFRADRPNGWIDSPASDASDPGASMSAFVSLMTQLCPSNAGEPSISFAVLCRSVQVVGAPVGPPISPVANELLERSLISGNDYCELADGIGIADTDVIVKSCMEWIDEGATAEEVTKRRQFLHALVLMQRTRFLAAVWHVPALADDVAMSEGDSRDRRKWLDRLEHLGLVRRKLGGFIWLHAECRNKLRKKLRDTPSHDAAEIGQLHWNLASWYHRILSASASPHALFEAVYHSCRSAEVPLKDRTAQSYSEACVRVAWATDALRHNSFLVQTLGYSRGSCRKLDQIRSELCDLCSPSAEDVETHLEAKRLASQLQKLRVVCTEIMRGIAREVGEIEVAYERHRQVRALMVCNDVTKSKEFRWTSLAEKCDVDEPVAGEPHPAVELIRWWKWNGMLAIAARSYHWALKSLVRGLYTASCTDPPDDKSKLATIVKEATSDTTNAESAKTALEVLLKSVNHEVQRLWRVIARGGDALRLRVEILRTAEQYVACRLQEHSVLRRGGKANSDALLEVSNCNSLALRFADSISAVAADGRVTAPVAWCKSRLLLHRGFIASLRDRHDDALAAFTDAEAALNLFDARRFGTDRGVVEFYRAEARLNEATSTPIPTGSVGTRSFGKTIDEIVQRAIEAPDAVDYLHEILPFAGRGANPLLAENGRAAFRTAGARVRDAIRFLDRGEDIFARRRRNAAWTTWYFHRRLRAVSLAIWASLTDYAGSPIPFLGAEAAIETSETLVDSLVGQALRLIRRDAYRLATIVEEYSLCALALRSRLILDKRVPRLTKRQKDMRRRLEEAVETLEKVRNERLSQERDDPSREMHPEVKEYIQKIIANCRDRSKCLHSIVP